MKELADILKSLVELHWASVGFPAKTVSNYFSRRQPQRLRQTKQHSLGIAACVTSTDGSAGSPPHFRPTLRACWSPRRAVTHRLHHGVTDTVASVNGEFLSQSRAISSPPRPHSARTTSPKADSHALLFARLAAFPNPTIQVADRFRLPVFRLRLSQIPFSCSICHTSLKSVLYCLVPRFSD